MADAGLSACRQGHSSHPANEGEARWAGLQRSAGTLRPEPDGHMMSFRRGNKTRNRANRFAL
jgi:hypothetical protein